MGYNVDLVLVIDTTSSMHGVIDVVKKNALNFCGDLTKKMLSYQKNIDELRVMAISFKDFYGDGDKSLEPSRFFNLPNENNLLNEFVGKFSAGGGHSSNYQHGFQSGIACPPESGLEALAYSIMKVDFSISSVKKRNVIVLWSDAYAHPLEAAHKECYNYPSWIPRDIKELTSMWGNDPTRKLTPSSKRLILFTPDVYPWNIISEEWENVIHHLGKAGTNNLTESDYNVILETIVNSI